MRNFSANSAITFKTFAIYEEYFSEMPSINDLLKSLSDAFETELSLVKSAWNHETLKGESESEYICLSEYRVLVELYDFFYWVDRSIQQGGRDTSSRVFSYFNLNTGRSVLWAHLVA